MAKHEIITHLPLHAMSNEDFTIEVRSNDKPLGDLIIGQGSVRWHPSGSPYAYKIGWERFGRMMKDKGRPT
jgi:hypothetical protein